MEYSSYQNSVILENIEIAPKVFKMTVQGPSSGEPGQFFMLRAWDRFPLLSRPFSICDRKDDKITFLYQVVGEGTQKISRLNKSDFIQLLGPLGNGFPINKDKKTAIIAGGIGIAPMKFLARYLNKPDLFVGFHDEPYFLDEMKPFVDRIFTATETGRYGTQGYVTEILKDYYDVIYCCGPNVMMNAVKDRIKNSELYLSLESHMACGIGACLGCAVQTTSGIQRVCHEGPVFLGKDVILDA